MNVFITGVSSGLGFGLAKAAQENGALVYGISRRSCSLPLAGQTSVDLEDLNSISQGLNKLLHGIEKLDVVVLNAAQLGQIKVLKEENLDSLDRLMKVNLWANKVIVDWVLQNVDHVEQFVVISSGASINGNAGWGGYSISKAALNMLVKLYASETPEVHFSSLAPGLIETSMQEYLCGLEEDDRFPSLERLRDARGTETMPSPEKAGRLIWDALPTLRECPSGSYQDIRKL